MTMSTVVIFDASSHQWLKFRNPEKIYISNEYGPVTEILDSVETDVADNKYAVGFVSYEAAPAFDSAFSVNHSGNFPLAWFAVYKQAEKFEFPQIDGAEIEPLSWKLSINEDEYHAALKRIKEYIRQGDTYQVNYTFRMKTPIDNDPWQLFVRMIHAQGNGYAAYIDTDDWCVCSASPELFFTYDNGRLVSKPMKGTVPRDKTTGSDEQRAEWLKNSVKNRAENLMIVDMVRNDMGQIASTGSVHTTSLFDIEKYPTIWQMTSTVEAQTDAGIREIFTALFPAASITGAPKTRTMEIISELETEPRKIYTGSIGLLRPDRSAQFNVSIRTVLIDKTANTAEYGVGGGIVWDSDTDNELDECYTKAKVLTHVQPEFELLETMRWTPAEGYTFFSYHLDRLSRSADYFSFKLDPEKIKNKLREAAREFSDSDYRVRLRVTREGEVLIDSSVIDQDMVKYSVHLAGRPVDPAGDLFLYHKTTRRQTYEEQMAEFPGYDDVLLFNTNKELTESCRANLVVEIDGGLYTPPVSCGLLPGTCRRTLLEQGKISERVITVDDLEKCSKIYLINSVRGMWEISPET